MPAFELVPTTAQATTFSFNGSVHLQGVNCSHFGSVDARDTALLRALDRAMVLFGRKLPTGAVTLARVDCGSVHIHYNLKLPVSWLQIFVDDFRVSSVALAALMIQDMLVHITAPHAPAQPSDFVYWALHELPHGTRHALLTAGVWVDTSTTSTTQVQFEYLDTPEPLDNESLALVIASIFAVFMGLFLMLVIPAGRKHQVSYSALSSHEIPEYMRKPPSEIKIVRSAP